jgi:hypothetical protein
MRIFLKKYIWIENVILTPKNRDKVGVLHLQYLKLIANMKYKIDFFIGEPF